MWIVQLALRRPYTFIVGALLVVLFSIYSIRQMPTDVLPSVDIPVISVVWTYDGLPALQVERQITQFSEYSLSNNVADLERIESQSFDGAGVIRVFLQPGTDVPAAMAQITAVSQTITRRMPPGTQPPIIIRYTASSVPILQIAFASDTLGEAEIADHVNQRVRTLLSTVAGTRMPFPMGGKGRLISVDVDPDKAKTYGLSAFEIASSVSLQNLVLPTGNAKLGDREYRVTLNSSPEAIAALNDMPVRRPDGGSVLLRDVAHVHDGFATQTNIARNNGKRSVVMSIMKTGDASTTEVAARIKALIPTIKAAAPPGLEVEVLADQSNFVHAAIEGLLVEGLIAAVLTAIMILLFLGSWRSTLVVAASIPLSVMIALIIMKQMGYTINAMTLGGLALAVGILVDDATVEIENIHRNLAQGKTLTRAILDGAQQIAVPAFVASACISIVFVSVIFLEGPARYLFMPMGIAVGLSVMASYLLSRTVTPTLVKYILKAEVEAHARDHGKPKTRLSLHDRFNARFEAFRHSYVGILERAIASPQRIAIGFVIMVLCTMALVPFVGRDFFPVINSGQVRLHVVAPSGTRIEQTERIFGEVEEAIGRIIPASDRLGILDMIGMPGGYNLAITDSTNVSSADGEILISLSEHPTHDAAFYTMQLRKHLSEQFPSLTFYFQPADIVTQILNFGLPSPIDIQVSGARKDVIYDIARAMVDDISKIRGAVDVRLFQVLNAPRLHIEVDRTRAGDAGLTQRDVANNVLLTVSSSSQVNPGYWIDPNNGNNYSVSVRVPEKRINSLSDLETISLPSNKSGSTLLADVADFELKATPLFISHVNVQPTFNVRADVALRDLGSVASAVDMAVDKYRSKLPPGSTITVRGQVDSMKSAFTRLGFGLLFAALLVYALMVVNFQSFRDPLIIITALPGAAIGIVWMLFVTQTTFSVPSLMGAIMSIGVATANSILIVSFANDMRLEDKDARQAALLAGSVRLRPVMMTALAMIIGMFPMSLGLGTGSEQNAALGRAVIGGLLGATVATLLFVPVIYSRLARKNNQTEALEPELAEGFDATHASLTSGPSAVKQELA